jgi:putative transposase
MPRTARVAPAGVIFHALNRGVGKRQIFHKEGDYLAFERVLAHCLEAVPIKLFAYCLMPNHWHLLLSPSEEGQLARFMARLTMTHTRRWQEHYQEVGNGHLYQGRFKSFPVQEDAHFLTVARYVERNALRANLVTQAQDWRWSSLGRRIPDPTVTYQTPLSLSDWPVDYPVDWLKWVQEPQTDSEIADLRLSIAKGRPFGDRQWQNLTTERLGLHSSYRRRGRPHLQAQPEHKS